MNVRVNLENKSAIILHHYNYRDSSLIVNFFLSDFGKVSAIAKGVKGKKSKQNQLALFQPFQKLTVSLTGKQELLILKSIELTSQSNFEPILSAWDLSGKSLYCAYYINELLLRLLPSHTDCSEIFSLYEQVLNILSHSSDQESTTQESSNQDSSNQYDLKHFEAPLRIFELKFLEYLGYGLNLSHDIQSDLPIDIEKQYFYIIDSGPTESPVNGIKNLEISGKTLIDLSHAQLSDKKTLQESKQLLKWAIAEHLDNKPLKSREMFKQLYC